ncbi:hypothetical protein DFH06DRAFT_1247884 [Mycena polygramma]|nr:hypothetical protein DFH06DRAFT_1247884 [Mycena polygramma]
MLAFQSTTLPAQWTDSPLLPAASAFDLAFHFDHPSPSPFPDAGRPDFESLSIHSIYYPVLPLDGEGVYRSPKAAFRKQVAANKADPRWKHAGIGLGLGLTGTTTHAGVLQWSYIQSRPPHFLGTPKNESQKPTAPPAPVSPDTVEAPASSLWAALTEFFDTTYSLLSGLDSPTPDTAALNDAQISDIILSTSTQLVADTIPAISLIVSAIDDNAVSPVPVPALPPFSVSVSPLPLHASLFVPHRSPHQLSPIGLVVSPAPVPALPPPCFLSLRSRSTRLYSYHSALRANSLPYQKRYKKHNQPCAYLSRHRTRNIVRPSALRGLHTRRPAPQSSRGVSTLGAESRPWTGGVCAVQSWRNS